MSFLLLLSQGTDIDFSYIDYTKGYKEYVYGSNLSVRSLPSLTFF